MSQKRKPKSNSLVDQFFNNVLFVKRYTFETSLPMYTVTNRLHELSDEQHGWLNNKSRYIVDSEDRYDHHTFEIRAKDRQQRYTITHAMGTVHSADHGGTVVEGEIRFGVVYFFLLMISILWLFFIFQYFGVQYPIWLMGLFMLSPTFTFVHMFRKRRQLIKSIQLAITPRMSDRNLSKSKQRKGLGEIYRDLEQEFDSIDDESSETYYYDQQ